MAVLQVLPAVGVVAERHEQGVILCHGEATIGHDDRRDGEGIAAEIGAVVRFDRGARRQQDQSRGGVDAQRLPIAVAGPQHHAEEPRSAGGGQRHGGVDGEAHTAGRERDAWGDRHAAVGLHSQPPRDAAQADAAAEIDDALAQSVLQVGEVIRRDAEFGYELRACIIRHSSAPFTSCRIPPCGSFTGRSPSPRHRAR
ncbi:MAG TPA: hypothetical protein VJO72_02340 [Candidatus Dormibacteraeota bacterium]|nr:hypothetical protein [Candidatus Dormibacteraeota bacterium]